MSHISCGYTIVSRKLILLIYPYFQFESLVLELSPDCLGSSDLVLKNMGNIAGRLATIT